MQNGLKLWLNRGIKPLPSPSVVLPDVKLPEVGGQLSAGEAGDRFSGGNAVAAACHGHHAPGARLEAIQVSSNIQDEETNLRAPSTMRVTED